MKLAEKIAMALNKAMKNREQFRVEALRLIVAAVKNNQIAKQADLTDKEIETLLQSEHKKRREAAEIFSKANRADLAQKETREAQLIEEFLPKQLSASEVEAEVGKLKAAGNWPADFGQAMKLAMAQLQGRASGETIVRAVKAVL